MSVFEGEALAHFINQNSARFEAGVLDLRTGCWVLLRDKSLPGRRGQPADLAPIVDFDQYLLGVRQNPEHLSSGLLELLEEWRANQQAV